MTRHNLLQGALSLSLLAVACGPTPVAETPRCLKLSQPAGADGLSTEKPAKVSLFFSVDTCDGQPVAGLDAAAFDLSEDGKAISPFESERTIQPKGQKSRMSSLLLLDLSGSELKSGQFPALKEAVLAYAQAVLGQAGDGERVALYGFDGRESPFLLADFTDSVTTVRAALDALEVPECSTNAQCASFPDRRACAGWRCVDDSTNLNGAVVEGLSILEKQVARDVSVTWRDGALVLFTDGTDQAARVEQQTALSRLAGSPLHVFSVGLGGEVDADALRAFGRDGYFPAGQPAQLAQAFQAVASRVSAMANRFYLLEYCSPKRSGTHALKVTATLPDGSAVPLVGDLSLPFDATGFTSGCSLSGR